MYGQTKVTLSNPQAMLPVRDAEVVALRAQIKRLNEIIRAYRVTLAEFTGDVSADTNGDDHV